MNSGERKEMPTVRRMEKTAREDSDHTRAGASSPRWKRMVVRTIIVMMTACVVDSARGQDLSTPIQGPAQSPERSEIEELKSKVKQLEQSVDSLKKKEPEPSEPLSPGTTTTVPAIDRERGLITDDAYADPRVDNAPFDPALRGFFRIPGTLTMMRVGGYIRTDAIYDFDQLGNINQFRPESIPIPSLGDSNFNMSARASRFSLESRSITKYGDVLRTYIEVDFVGSGNRTEFRLRHFYGQWRNILVGQAWSTFHDSDVIPETSDFNGPNSWIFQFSPQIRYTYALTERQTIAAAVEQPSAGIPATNPVRAESVSATNPLPDFVIRYRYETDDYHFNTAALFRSVGGVTTSGHGDHVLGYGLMASGLVRLWGRDNFVFQAVYGQGISRYFTDTKNLNLDVGYDASGTFNAQPAYGGYAAVQHFWNDNWRSTVTYGFLQVNTSESSPADIYKRTQYVDCNLLYSPVPGFTVGGGVLWGERVNKNDESGDGFRINFLLKYDLVKLQQDMKKVLPF